LEHLERHVAGKTGISTPSVMVGGKVYRVYQPETADALINEVEFDHDERLPYWADLSPSAIALARHVAELELAGERVVEVGCGVGLPAMAALANGADVTVTDHYEAALDFAAHNARENTGRSLSTAMLDWRKPETWEGLESFDVLLGADVLYESRNIAPLADVVEALLEPEGEALFADPGRREAGKFLEEMGRWRFETDATQRVVEGEPEVRSTIHRLRRR
jgi:predicted nicotinamide N-methyase